MKHLLWLMLLASCASGLRVNPGKCSGLVRLKQKNEKSQEQKRFILREYGIGQKKIALDDLLKEAKAPDCLKLQAVNIVIESDFWDQVVSMIPLVSQWSIKINWDEVIRSK